MLGEVDLLTLPAERLPTVRGRRIALVPQGAMSALNPVLRVGDQVAESVYVHTGASRPEARERAAELLDSVGLGRQHLLSYPHELSGGMRQRAVIAMALTPRPEVVVADEPTTGLDVVVQAQVLRLLKGLQEELGLTLVLASHDLRVVLRVCDRVTVMYAGAGVETRPRPPRRGSAPPPLHRGAPGYPAPPGAGTAVALHPGELARQAAAPRRVRLPSPVPLRPGGVHARGARAAPSGGGRGGLPPLPGGGPGRGGLSDPGAEAPGGGPGRRAAPGAARGLQDLPPARGDLREGASGLRSGGLRPHRAGREVAGLIGESGSGKTTLARVVLRLVEPSGGEVRFAGHHVLRLRGAGLRRYRRQVALVSQDPYDALHPGMRVGDLVAEPLRIAGEPVGRRRSRVAEALDAVGLPPTPELLSRHAGQLSGGQRQRVALARALAPRPRLLVADEPTSMLDVSVRGGILATLLDLKERLGLTMLLITHDLAEAAYLCDTVYVLRGGRVVERGPAAEVTESPRHPHSQALAAAAADPLAPAAESAGGADTSAPPAGGRADASWPGRRSDPT